MTMSILPPHHTYMAPDGFYFSPTQAAWMPPPIGTVKLNFDGGLSRLRGCAVAGGIFRDHQGVPLFCYTCADPEIVGFTPYDGEAKALALGLMFARNLGFSSNLWVEGDAKYLIEVVPGRRPNTMYDKDTIDSIRRAIDEFPRKPLLTWVPREANSAADALVRHMRDDVSTILEEKWDRGAKLPTSVATVVEREHNGYVYVRQQKQTRPLPFSGLLPNSEKLHLLTHYNVLANAAAKGMVEILRECVEFCPDALWFTSNNETLLQTCIKHRQEKVFNLLQEVTAQNKLMADRIVYGDTTLHLVAKMAPIDKLKAVSGSALQMQSEIQWFKAVEKLLRPIYISYRNHERVAAHELFTKDHEKLLESGEKWMKDTSSSCMVVATLIATVVFAAAFTVPGGNNQDTGIPIFLKETSFLVFAISDAVALFSSTTSILMFLSILTSRFAEQDFLYALPRRVIIGLASLFFGIVTMLIAFGAVLSVVLVNRFSWIAFPVLCWLAFLWGCLQSCSFLCFTKW